MVVAQAAWRTAPRVIGALLLLAAAPWAAAVNILECVDADGRKTLADRCPPGTTQVGEQEIRIPGNTGLRHATPEQLRQAGKPIERPRRLAKVVMYSMEGCRACDKARNYLQDRGVAFKEKDIADERWRDELVEQVGFASVPLVTVGKDLIHGYKKAAMKASLDAAGYP